MASSCGSVSRQQMVTAMSSKVSSLAWKQARWLGYVFRQGHGQNWSESLGNLGRGGISLCPSLSLFLCPPEKKAFCICFKFRQLIKHLDVPLPTRSSCFYYLEMLLCSTPKLSPIPWYLVAITKGNIWVMGGTESLWTGSPPIDSTVPALISQLKDSSNISLP